MSGLCLCLYMIATCLSVGGTGSHVGVWRIKGFKFSQQNPKRQCVRAWAKYFWFTLKVNYLQHLRRVANQLLEPAACSRLLSVGYWRILGWTSICISTSMCVSWMHQLREWCHQLVLCHHQHHGSTGMFCVHVWLGSESRERTIVLITMIITTLRYDNDDDNICNNDKASQVCASY